MMSKKKIVLIALSIVGLAIFINSFIYFNNAFATNNSSSVNNKSLYWNKTTNYFTYKSELGLLNLNLGKPFDFSVKKNNKVSKTSENKSAKSKDGVELSGIDWCKRYTNSSDIKDLNPEFRKKISRFINALKKAGATVDVLATLRTEQSCYLFHYAWLIAKNQINPEDVPLRSDVKINWCHHNYYESIAAAQNMVYKWDLGYEPALYSNHIGGNAIDMKISWKATSKNYIQIDDANGIGYIISTSKLPTDPAGSILIGIGKTYGVYNLKGDIDHWSSNGH